MNSSKRGLLLGGLVVALAVVLCYGPKLSASKGDIWSIYGTGVYRNTDLLRVPVAGTSLLPGTANYFTLGSSSYRFANIYTTLLNISGASTLTGATTVTGALSANGGLAVVGATGIYSRTEAQLKVSTPTAVGQMFYDSTNKAVVVSTGTTSCLSYGQVNAGGTAPAGW